MSSCDVPWKLPLCDVSPGGQLPSERLKGFNASFSWEYPEKWCLKDVQEAIFHVFDANAKPKYDLETLMQTCGCGVTLTQPNSKSGTVPCELLLKPHSNSVQCRITKMCVISEAKHIELYVDDMYETTSKGHVISMEEVKMGVQYENELDLSAHIHGNQNVSLKFLSLANKQSIRIEAIVLTIIECKNVSHPEKCLSSTDVHSVRDMIKSMNMEVTGGAEKLMKDIESRQQSQNQLLFQKLFQNGNLNSAKLEEKPANVTPLSQVEMNDDFNLQQLGINQNSLPTLLAQFQNVLSSPSGLNNILTNMSSNETYVDATNLNRCHERDKLVNNGSEKSPRVGDAYTQNHLDILTRNRRSRSNSDSLISCNGVTGTQNGVHHVPTETYNGFHIATTGMHNGVHLATTGMHNGVHHVTTETHNGVHHATTETHNGVHHVTTETHNGFHHNNDKYSSNMNGTMNGNDTGRCTKCGCTGCDKILNGISKSLISIERNLVSHIDVKIDELRHHLDKRLNDIIK